MKGLGAPSKHLGPWCCCILAAGEVTPRESALAHCSHARGVHEGRTRATSAWSPEPPLPPSDLPAPTAASSPSMPRPIKQRKKEEYGKELLPEAIIVNY